MSWLRWSQVLRLCHQSSVLFLINKHIPHKTLATKGKEGITASNTNSLFPEEAAFESCQWRLTCFSGIGSGS